MFKKKKMYKKKTGKKQKKTGMIKNEREIFGTEQPDKKYK